jgi:hypothetical protein
MKEQLTKPTHESYRRHRNELAWKIIFPVILSSVLCIGMVVLINLATFASGGDVERWAAISTMWIAIPTMIGMLIFLAVAAGLIYLLAKLLGITPKYTAMAQDFVYKIKGYVQRTADAAVKPIINLNSIGASIGRLFGRE